MGAVYKKELKSYFYSATGYMFSAFMLLFAGVYTMAININGAQSSFESVVGNMSFIFIIIIPVLTMRVISEERKQKTDILLYSLPLSMAKIVTAKYLAMITVVFIPIFIMGFYPLILSLFGTVNFAGAYSALFGFFLLGAALTAVGMFASSLTENQAVAAVVTFLIVLLNYFIPSLSYYLSSSAEASLIAVAILIVGLGIVIQLLTKNSNVSFISTLAMEVVLAFFYFRMTKSLEGLFPEIMSRLSMFERFYVFIDGEFDLTCVAYLAAAAFIFVFLTVQSMEKRRWS